MVPMSSRRRAVVEGVRAPRLSLAIVLSICVGACSQEDPTFGSGFRPVDHDPGTGAGTGASGGDSSGLGGGTPSGLGSGGGAGSSAICSAAGPFPDPEWPEGDPLDHGLDPVKVELAAQYAGAHKSNCLLVIRHGVLVFERYWQGTDRDTKVKSWSVGKSYASTVAGLALDHGALGDVNDSVADYVPELVGSAKEPITLHHLMAMASGLYMDLVADNAGITGAPDMTQRALDWEVTHPPGVLWEYNNHAVQLMEPVLRNATGMYADEYARQHLWGPIGMDAEWMKDDVGHPALYMNVLASCRDHARFGYLFLKRGCWNGTQVLSEAWVDRATAPSQNMSRGYGYWWWLNGETPTLDSTDFSVLPGGSLHPFAPDDAFCAVGLGSQVIEVIPSLDMVVVRFGTAPQDDWWLWLHPLQLLEALLADGKQLVHNGVLTRVLDAVTY